MFQNVSSHSGNQFIQIHKCTRPTTKAVYTRIYIQLYLTILRTKRTLCVRCIRRAYGAHVFMLLGTYCSTCPIPTRSHDEYISVYGWHSLPANWSRIFHITKYSTPIDMCFLFLLGSLGKTNRWLTRNVLQFNCHDKCN